MPLLLLCAAPCSALQACIIFSFRAPPQQMTGLCDCDVRAAATARQTSTAMTHHPMPPQWCRQMPPPTTTPRLPSCCRRALPLLRRKSLLGPLRPAIHSQPLSMRLPQSLLRTKRQVLPSLRSQLASVTPLQVLYCIVLYCALTSHSCRCMLSGRGRRAGLQTMHRHSCPCCYLQ